jgi:hypothetical protein
LFMPTNNHKSQTVEPASIPESCILVPRW